MMPIIIEFGQANRNLTGCMHAAHQGTDSSPPSPAAEHPVSSGTAQL